MMNQPKLKVAASTGVSSRQYRAVRTRVSKAALRLLDVQGAEAEVQIAAQPTEVVSTSCAPVTFGAASSIRTSPLLLRARRNLQWLKDDPDVALEAIEALFDLVYELERALPEDFDQRWPGPIATTTADGVPALEWNLKQGAMLVVQDGSGWTVVERCVGERPTLVRGFDKHHAARRVASWILSQLS